MWSDLTMSQKADIMRIAIQNGMTDLNDIRSNYNEFAEGGYLENGETEPTQQMDTGKILNHDYQNDVFTGATLPGWTVTRRNNKTYFNIGEPIEKKKQKPYFVSSRTGQLTAGDAMKGIDAAVGPVLHWMQPSQYVGAFRDAIEGKNPINSMLRGNSGVVAEEFEKNNPLLSTALNLGTDVVGLAGAAKALRAIKSSSTPAQKWSQAVEMNGTPKGLLSEEPLIAKGFISEVKPIEFESELDWSPTGWFKDYAKRKSWTEFDEQSLASHVPEYLEIERISKANNTWLRMPDGSLWNGDPREWVMAMSKNADWLNVPNGFKSGVKPYYIRTLPEYNGIVFEANEPLVYESFANYKGRPYYDPHSPEGGVYTHALSKDARIKTINTDGGDWSAIKIGNDKKHIETLIREAEDEGYDALRINGIQEGPQLYLPEYQTTDDLIILGGKKRKILTGNNGNLDPKSGNNFGSLVPWIISGGAGFGIANYKQ